MSEPPSIRRRFPRHLKSLKSMRDFVVEHSSARGLDGRRAGDLALALEELAVNAINYDDGAGDDLSVEISSDDKGVYLTFSEKGKEFNPLSQPPPELSDDIRKRPIGGLGIFMVRRLTDGIEYKRTNGNNVLTLTMKRR